MVELSPQEIRDELIFLISESVQEMSMGRSQVAVSMLIEVQCLIAGTIEAELNKALFLTSLGTFRRSKLTGRIRVINRPQADESRSLICTRKQASTRRRTTSAKCH
jgi:hypothetical protein